MLRPPAPSQSSAPRGRVLLASLLACALGPSCGESAPAPSTPRDAPRTVLLVSLDTLRPGRLGVYGGAPEVSPRLDALAREAVVFDDALAPAPWTLPSHMTLLTGLDPVAHDVRVSADVLSPDVTTLAEALSAAGFATAAFTDGGYMDGGYGFTQGFDVYDDDRPNRLVHGMEHLAPLAAEWLASQEGNDAFLFVHTFDAHSPYDSPPPDVLARFRARPAPDGPDDHALHFLSHFAQQRRILSPGYRRMSELLNDYDAGVHVADRGVGVLLDALQRTGRAANALVIVTSDHGESFFDRGLHVGHGLLPSAAELAIPLMVRFPDGAGAGTRRPELVSLIDLAPTVLDAFDLEAPADWQGESLRGLIDGRPRRIDAVLGASRNLHCWFLAKDEWIFVTPMGADPLMVARAHLGPDSGSGASYAFGPADERVTLQYDAVGDPFGLRELIPASVQLHHRRVPDREQVNRWTDEPELGARMLEMLSLRIAASTAVSARLRSTPSARPPGEDRAMQRALAELGYVGGDKTPAPSAVDLPALMAKRAATPLRPADTTHLVDGDRLVHRVRNLLAEGGRPGDAERAALQEAGRLYASWLAEHPGAPARVAFRFTECLRIAEDAGLHLDSAAWQTVLGGGH